MSEWFSDWFGAEYSDIYAHRDQQEAEKQVSFYLSLIETEGVPLSGTFLDIACGAGRHLKAMRANGLNCVGIDLSQQLLEQAGLGGVIRADMRKLPFKERCISGISNFFTSFGYLETDEAHRELLLEWRRVLLTDGILLLDFLNEKLLRDSLIPESRKETEKYIVIESRRIDEKRQRVIKEICITEKASSEEKYFSESVRLFSSGDIAAMLEQAGFTGLKQFGDFEGSQVTDTSARVLSFARAARANMNSL